MSAEKSSNQGNDFPLNWKRMMLLSKSGHTWKFMINKRCRVCSCSCGCEKNNVGGHTVHKDWWGSVVKLNTFGEL